MIAVAWTFALLAAAIHIVVWAWEALLIERPFVHQRVFSTPAADLPAIRLWTFGLGFYNLFLGVGMIVGVALWAAGAEAAGRTLVVYITAFMVLCGVVLFVDDRLGFGRVRGKHIGGAFGQAVPPLVALVATLLA
jgi:putative membrane protein